MSPLRGALYSFRRCPYAIRARLAIGVSGIALNGHDLEVREVVLRNKPDEMLAISPKGTVPILQLPDGTILEESRDIMAWALSKRDPQRWLRGWEEDETQRLLEELDGSFKTNLDRYKYPERQNPALGSQVGENDFPGVEAFRAASDFLERLETRLVGLNQLTGDKPCALDAAIFPFVRQFADVDSSRFTSSFPNLNAWRERWQESALFQQVMRKTPAWEVGTTPVAFSDLYGSDFQSS